MQLLMDVYLPMSDTESARPLVLYFHTGNFFPFKNPDPGSPVQYGFNGACGGQRDDSAAVEICTRLAQMGYVAASCDYRLGWLFSNNQAIRRYTFVNAVYRGIQDANTAIRFFRRSVAGENNKYGIDPDRIVLFGDGTGGYISLNAAMLDNYNKIPATPNGKFLWNPQLSTGHPCAPNEMIPVVTEAVNGNLEGTSVGVSPVKDPLNNCAVIRLDTLCYPNWPGYSSRFNLAVNLGGALLDTSWIDNVAQNPQPALISFHVPNDPDAPYTSGTFDVPGPNPALPVLEVHGSYFIHQQMEDAGQQEIFLNTIGSYLNLHVNQQDAFAGSPVGMNDPRAALYPLLMPPDPVSPELPLNNAPWAWTSFPGIIVDIGTSLFCNTNKVAAIPYIDTIIQFYAPRACFALGLQGCIDDILSNKEPIAQNIQLTVSPNPATDQVILKAEDGNMILSVQVIDKTGRLVSNIQNVDNEVYTFRRNTLPAGHYIFKVNFKEGFVTKMVVFERV